ncbi:hypothetical protein MYOV002v2_p0069 [Vibrio phage 144E46.1]|nr:hypothetical protein MYOV002v2_p0069 [Vibrio phage 144E46.1]
MIGRIYKVTNTVNGMVYIGFTTQDLKDRMLDHKYKAIKYESTRDLHKAIRDFGYDKFVAVELESGEHITIDSDHESRYINEYESVDRGYNMTSKARNTFTKETNPSLSEFPWQTPKVTSNPHILERWLRLGDVYDVWVQHGRCGYSTLRKLGGFDFCLRTMVDFLKVNGDPRLIDAWRQLK